MSSNDDAIARGRRRRKLVAISSFVSLLLVALMYFTWLFLTKGFSFNVTPEPAAQTNSFAVTGGNGFFIGDKLYVLGSEATATISAPKYKPAVVSVNAASPSMIHVELQPLPATVVFKTEPQVENVAWLVNGQQVKTATVFETELEAGRYTITATHPSYESGSVTFDAEIAGEVYETISLTPISGTMTIRSVPLGANVSVEGEPVGVTPLTLSRPGGQYAVVVTKEGYEPIKDVIQITTLRPEPTRDYRLQALQARLSVTLAPQGGALLLNGKPVGNPMNLDADTKHSIRYEKPGFIAQEKSITLSAGESGNMAFNLTPEIGKVTFTANEPAQVYVNGVAKGTTPLNLDMQALPAKVEFKRNGYRTVTKEFTPSSKALTRVEAEMLKEFEARRREGKPLFVSTLGIEMAKVQPRAFTMGSYPNEKDRQRNEHPVKVSFTRSVWISRHEITEAQFAAFKKQGGGTQMPVTNVTWEEAAAFTNWLSEQEGLLPFYIIKNSQVVGVNKEARGYRLPTEAEWEFIAKLNRRAKPTIFVWGSTEHLPDKQGNFADVSLKGQQTFILSDYNDGFAGKAPVGSFKAERGGFFDLDGNVREWMHDLYSVTPPDTNLIHSDYLGVERGSAHVVKGGSYKTGRMKNLRASAREGENDKADDIGFRIARYDF